MEALLEQAFFLGAISGAGLSILILIVGLAGGSRR